MSKSLLAALVAVCALSGQGVAQDRVTLGWGRLFSNDAIGDGHDRWRTGSYTVSVVRGTSWDGALPSEFGEILEFRLRADTIAPASLTNPDPGDRRYAGALTLAAFTHAEMLGFETSVGAGIVATGPQTGIGAFQREVHELFDLDEPEVLDDQIGNRIHALASAEVGRTFRFGDRVALRPFLEAQAGVESLVRVGGDLVIGRFGTGALMLRDQTTGQRYRGIAGVTEPGLSLTMGADVAHVFDSVYLPDDEPAVLSDDRARVRAGLHWQGDASDVFYGVTWLGREFEGQDEGQVVGSLRVRVRF